MPQINGFAALIQFDLVYAAIEFSVGSGRADNNSKLSGSWQELSTRNDVSRRYRAANWILHD